MFPRPSSRYGAAMCNLYRMEKAADAIMGLVRELGRTLEFPEGVPNFQPRDIRITERAPLLRAAGEGHALELVERRWSWPAPSGKPVFNYRSEGRRFPTAKRCVVLADGFYEFTEAADAKARKKDRWLFTWPQHDWFGIAAILRQDPSVGEAFSLLTCAPGPDIARFHDRQIVLLAPEECLAWLERESSAADLVRPLPDGTLEVTAA